MSRDESLGVNRREALGMLGAGFWAARGASAADQPFNFTTLDHVEFTVADVEKSVAFYARIFGNTVLKNKRTARRYLKLGPSYIAIDQSNEPRVDHFSAGVEGFDVAKTHAYLDQKGVAYRDFPSGRDLNAPLPNASLDTRSGRVSVEGRRRSRRSHRTVGASSSSNREVGAHTGSRD